MKEFTVNRNDSGQRLDKYLLKSIPLLPSSLMHKYIRLKRIKLNGKRCQANTILNPGDVLTLYINDEFFDSNDFQAPRIFGKNTNDAQIALFGKILDNQYQSQINNQNSSEEEMEIIRKTLRELNVVIP